MSERIKPMTVGDLRSVLDGLADDMPVVYCDGKHVWPVDEWGIHPDGFNLFANEAPESP